jgi:hypothetical protein
MGMQRQQQQLGIQQHLPTTSATGTAETHLHMAWSVGVCSSDTTYVLSAQQQQLSAVNRCHAVMAQLQQPCHAVSE